LAPGDGYLAGPRPSRLGLDLNVLGPLARSAGDLDLLLGVLAGPPEPDAAAWRLRLPEPPGAALRGYRIGLWLDDPFCPVDSASAKVFGALADRLADAGACLDEARPGVGFEESYATYWTLLMAAGGLNAGPGITHAEWLAADEERQRQRAVWRAWFADHDALLCPVLARTAYPHDHDGDYTTRMVPVNGTPRSHAEIARWTGLVGGLGLPCAVAPIGVDASGLPVGVQIITARWHDRTAIRLAGLIGELTGGYRVPPAVDSEREAR
jgi:amidase